MVRVRCLLRIYNIIMLCLLVRLLIIVQMFIIMLCVFVSFPFVSCSCLYVVVSGCVLIMRRVICLFRVIMLFIIYFIIRTISWHCMIIIYLLMCLQVLFSFLLLLLCCVCL